MTEKQKSWKSINRY